MGTDKEGTISMYPHAPVLPSKLSFMKEVCATMKVLDGAAQIPHFSASATITHLGYPLSLSPLLAEAPKVLSSLASMTLGGGRFLLRSLSGTWHSCGTSSRRSWRQEERLEGNDGIDSLGHFPEGIFRDDELFENVAMSWNEGACDCDYCVSGTGLDLPYRDEFKED